MQGLAPYSDSKVVSSKASQFTSSSQNLARKSTNPFDFDYHEASAIKEKNEEETRQNQTSDDSQNFRASASINFQDFATFFSKFDQQKLNDFPSSENVKKLPALHKVIFLLN